MSQKSTFLLIKTPEDVVAIQNWIKALGGEHEITALYSIKTPYDLRNGRRAGRPSEWKFYAVIISEGGACYKRLGEFGYKHGAIFLEQVLLLHPQIMTRDHQVVEVKYSSTPSINPFDGAVEYLPLEEVKKREVAKQQG